MKIFYNTYYGDLVSFEEPPEDMAGISELEINPDEYEHFPEKVCIDEFIDPATGEQWNAILTEFYYKIDVFSSAEPKLKKYTFVDDVVDDFYKEEEIKFIKEMMLRKLRYNFVQKAKVSDNIVNRNVKLALMQQEETEEEKQELKKALDEYSRIRDSYKSIKKLIKETEDGAELYKIWKQLYPDIQPNEITIFNPPEEEQDDNSSDTPEE